jgi:hypothetical protein
MNRLRPTCMNTYAAANTSPREPKASGSDVESTRPASIRTNNMRRTAGVSGSSQLVTHDVWIQTHQTAISSSVV